MDLQNWFENKYLKWQLENGRATIEDFAKYVGISKSYATLILNGQRKNVSMPTAIQIAQKLNDYTILDILGYARPSEFDYLSDEKLAPIANLILQFPEEVRPQIRTAIAKVLATMIEANEIPSEEETLKLMAEKILSEIEEK